MKLQRKKDSIYAKAMTADESAEVARIDARLLELVNERRGLTTARQLITNRACVRARAAGKAR